jgi:hypothetical protein
MCDEWFPFDRNLKPLLLPISAVYELADEDGMTIYIGGTDNLRSRIEGLIEGSDRLGIRRYAKLCRLEYRDDARNHVRFLRKLFLDIYERDPIFNEYGISG